MLSSGSESWLGISSRTMKSLEKLQLKFLRIALSANTGTPKVLLYSQIGTSYMSNRILLRKLCFLWHLSSLTPDSSLARDMFMFELQHNNMKGLVWELKPHLANMGVNIEVLNTFTKVQWKAKAKAYIFSKNKSELLATAVNYKKSGL